MKLLAAVGVMLGALVVAVVGAADAHARTCQSGRTVYAAQGVRVFEAGGQDNQWFACRPGSRRPKVLFSAGASLATFAVDGRDGTRVVFHATVFSEGGGVATEVGWFDARTSEVRTGLLATENEARLLDVAVAADGGVGVSSREEESPGRVGYLAPAPTAGDLRTERVLASLGGPPVRGSLKFGGDDESLRWRVRGRAERRVPLAGERPSCRAGTTLREIDGARLFEVIRPRRPQRALLLACSPGATVPRRLAVAGLGEPWSIASVRRSGRYTAFRAGPSGIGLIDRATGQLRFATVEDITTVDDVAVGSGGAVALAGRSARQQVFVARLPTTSRSFAPYERLATVGGELEAGSLAIGDDGRVRWRTSDGARSVPLAGESDTTCASGTPLREAGGLRVFEVLPAGGTDARLLACPPGTTIPVLLATGSREQSWKVRELARQNGRVALFAAMISGESRRDEVLSFAAVPGSVRRGTPGDSAAYAEIRDATVAEDGRVGVAVRSLGTWRIGYFALGSTPATLRRERRLAKPRDGVKPGSLRFSADGTRLTWRSRSGRRRGVALPGEESSLRAGRSD